MTLPFSDPVLVFATVLAVILVAPLVFARLRLPGIIGIIVVGVAVGPNALGWLALDGTIRLLGTVGLLYIMFLAGLEISLSQFARQRRESLAFGAITFAIPQFVGTAFFRLLGFDWTAAILIASMFASHTLVAYPVITRLGITRNRAVVTTVGGTILTDTVALLILAVVARSVQGELSPAFWMQLGLSLVVYVAAIVLLLPRLGRWFFRAVSDGTSQFLFILTVAFGVSYLARAIGIEPILGAFLAGLVLNRLVPESGPLMNRVQFVGNALFIPFFLLYIGMLVDLDVLAGSLAAWGVMAAMLGTNVVTKLVASKLTQRLFGYTAAEGWVIFGLSTTEAAATLAATLVGYELGIIGDDVLNGVILMILVTCIMGPAVVERFGRRIALAEADAPPDDADAPERTLVPLANPETAPELIALALAARPPGAAEPLYPLAVAPPGADVDAAVASSERLLAAATAHATAADVPTVALTRVDPNVAGGILRAVAERRIARIVIGWNGRPSLETRVFGSVLDALVDEAPAEILVCRPTRPLPTHRRVVVAVPAHAEREPGFERLARTIKRLAAQAGADVLVLAEPGSVEPVVARLTAARPEAAVTTETVEDLAALVETLDTVLRPDDLLVLVGARPGTLSWRAALERLPRVLATRFDGHSLVVGYPALRPSPAAEPPSSVA